MAKTKLKKAPVKKGSNSITMKEVNTAITAMVTASQAFGLAATSASIIALTHCMQHGDATGLQRMYNALGETGARVGPDRQKAFKRWLSVYSPVRQNNKTKDFGLIKADAPNYVAFDIDGAESTPFLDFERDRTKGPTMYSNEILGNKIAKMLMKDYGDNWEGTAFSKEAVVRAADAAIARAMADA